MKIKTKQNCIWIRDAESPYALFENKENLLKQIANHECLVLIVEPSNTFKMPQDSVQCELISEFFSELPVLTIIADTALEKTELAALLLFDIRLGCSDYVICKDTVLSAKQKSQYEILCGEKALLKYLSFADSETEESLVTNLVRVLPQSANFHEEVNTYVESLLEGKSSFQIKAVISCFVQARKGDSMRILYEESRQFYRLMKAKMEESANGIHETMV
ncbi:MAG: hypothetical protein ACI4I6_00610 [Hominimerdicola sp.]